MSDKLDYMLMASMRKESGINILEASTFVLGLRKMAQDAAPIDITGTIEGQFTVPLDQAISLMAQMVSNEFKTQAYYVYYGNMLRGTDRAGIAEEFGDHAKDELEHANYLLRRIGVLSPGGISIPPYPPPRPLYNSQQIIREMIVVEQIGLSLWKQLHSILGDNPMKYTVEQFLQTEEAHQDELWQFLDPMAPEQQMDEAAAMPEAPKTAAEIFAAAAVRKQAAQSVLSEHSDHPGSMMVSNLKRLADQSKQLSAAVSVEDNAEPWVESKIDRASEAIDAVHDYMKYKSEKKAAHESAFSEWRSLHPTGDDGKRMETIVKTPHEDDTYRYNHETNHVEWKHKGKVTEIGKPGMALTHGGREMNRYALMNNHYADNVNPYYRAALREREQSKKASHALSADEMATAGWDRNRAGKKEHSVKEAQAAQSMGKPTVPEHDELVRAGMDRRKKAMIHTASDNSEGAMNRDKVIKDKARELMAKATSGYRSLADMIHHKDQARTEVTPMDPAALQKQQAPFVVKTNPAVVRPQDPENHTPISMRGPLPMPKQASLGDLVLKAAGFAPAPSEDPNATMKRRTQGSVGRAGAAVEDFINRSKRANMIVPSPGADNPEAYVMREQQLIAQQAQGEAAHQKAISAQASQAAQQAQSEAQAAQQQLQEVQQQLQEAQQQAEQASQQQTQSAQQAAEAEARAADHSIQKMQLGMRVNQLRQSLANLVMQDPVSENSGTVSDLAATGQPATPQQQQEAEAQQQQAQAAPPSAGTQQQEAEAQNAQQDAQVQEQQAQQAQAQDQAKQSGLKFAFLGGAAERAARSATQGALEEAEGVRRLKTAAPADLNMARAIHAMEEGPLREQLMSVIKQKMPGTAARAAVHNAANRVVDEVRQEAPRVIAEGGKSLYEKARPHLPGFVAGLGTAYVGSKLLGGGQPEQPQQASPLTYAQYYSGQG